MRLKNKLADIFHKPDKQERLVQAALLVVFLILVAGAGLGISVYKNHTEAGEETVTITKDEVSSDVKEYLAAYVVSDGFINTISSDQNLQDQLLAKLESGTSKLTQEQIQKIVDTASAQYQILSELDINELDEEQIRALEAAIYQNVKGLMPEDAAEDIEIIANGVSAIIEQNMIRQLEAMDASIEALQQEIAAIKNNILGSENLKELNDALAGMTGDIDAINTYVAGLKTSLEAEDEKLNRDIQDISSDLDNLHTYCDETATVLIKVRAYMDSINNSSVTNLSQNVDEMYKILETAGMSIEKLSNKILVIENSLKELSKSTDISGLLQELASLKNNVNNASSSLNSFKSELENNRSKTNELISNLKAEDISLLNKIEALNKTFTTLQAQAQDSINKLISQLNTANKNISSLQDTAKGALSDISSLQNITKGALEEIASILKDIDDIRARLEELEREKHIIIEIVNSLTVDDSSKALSAAMGYQLELEIQALRSDLEQSVQNLQAEIKNIEVTINNITNAELDGSLQAQIDALRKQVNDCFIYVSSGKKDLASALADKGVKVDAKAEFSEFVKGIQKIGANTTAKESHILEGYIAYGNNKYLTGTMPNIGAVNKILAAGERYTVPKGYHNGSGTVTVKTLAEQTPATAAAAHMIQGATAWVNGVKITGTMPNAGAVSRVLSAGDSYTVPAGYHNGSGTVTAKTLAEQTPATATAANLIQGATAWVNGVKITGTGVNRGTVSKTLSAGESYTIPAGYHSGSGTVTAKTLAEQTPANAIAANLSQGITAWVNGIKITGTGEDNNSYYDQGRNQGHEDVIADPGAFGIDQIGDIYQHNISTQRFNDVSHTETVSNYWDAFSYRDSVEYQIPLKSDQILYAITLDLEYYAISGYDSPCVVAYSYNVRTAEGTVIQSDSIGGTNTGTVANFGTVTKNILIDLLQRPFSTGHEYLVLTIEYSMDGQVTNSQNQMCQAKIGFTNIEARYK